MLSTLFMGGLLMKKERFKLYNTNTETNFSIFVPSLVYSIVIKKEELPFVLEAVDSLAECYMEGSQDEDEFSTTFEMLDSIIEDLTDLDILLSIGKDADFGFLKLHIYELNVFLSSLEIYKDVLSLDDEYHLVAKIITKFIKQIKSYMKQNKNLVTNFLKLPSKEQREIFDYIYYGGVEK